MNRHTPGPWKMRDANPSIDDFVRYRINAIVEDGSELTVAEVLDDTVTGEALGNALMIVAAPKLLSALEGLLAAWPKQDIEEHDDIGSQGHDFDGGCYLCAARQAIRKAKGANNAFR